MKRKFTQKKTNKHYKPSYANCQSVSKRKSNTNLPRKFSKKNLSEKRRNHFDKNSRLNARRSHSTNKNTPTDVPAAKETENNKNEAMQNETEILKNKIALIN